MHTYTVEKQKISFNSTLAITTIAGKIKERERAEGRKNRKEENNMRFKLCTTHPLWIY